MIKYYIYHGRSRNYTYKVDYTEGMVYSLDSIYSVHSMYILTKTSVFHPETPTPNLSYKDITNCYELGLLLK